MNHNNQHPGSDELDKIEAIIDSTTFFRNSAEGKAIGSLLGQVRDAIAASRRAPSLPDVAIPDQLARQVREWTKERDRLNDLIQFAAQPAEGSAQPLTVSVSRPATINWDGTPAEGSAQVATAEQQDQGECDSALRAEPAGQHDAALAVLSAVRDGTPLREPVSIRRAVLAHREVRVSLSGGTGPAACAMIANIQLTGWKYGSEEAEAFAKGFNNAINWYRDGLLDLADKASAEAATRCRAEGGNTKPIRIGNLNGPLPRCPKCGEVGWHDCSSSGIAAEGATPADAWISVDERLPEKDANVLIAFWPYNNRENEQVAEQAYYSDGSFLHWETGDEMHPPSHWQPLVLPRMSSTQQPEGDK